MEKKRFRMPTAFTILFILIAVVALATWFIPAGSYEYVDGVPQAGTYHAVSQSPQGIDAVLKAAFSGFYDAVDVCVFILMVGGFLGVVMKTGAVDAGVSHVIRALGDREKWLIPILMLLFDILGSDTKFGCLCGSTGELLGSLGIAHTLHHSCILVESSRKFGEVLRGINHLRLSCIYMLDVDVLDISIVVGRAVEHSQASIYREVVGELIRSSESESVVILATAHI